MVLVRVMAKSRLLIAASMRAVGSSRRSWLLRGVPLTTVQAWLGHGSIEVTARYLHHLGDSADRSALQLLNDAAAPRALSG